MTRRGFFGLLVGAAVAPKVQALPCFSMGGYITKPSIALRPMNGNEWVVPAVEWREPPLTVWAPSLNE